MAQKWGIPVVGLEFVDKCFEGGKLLEADPFVVAGKTAARQFSTGKVVGERERGGYKEGGMASDGAEPAGFFFLVTFHT